MLSFKYMMAKSKELTSKLELSNVVNSVRSSNAEPSNGATPTPGSDVLAAKTTADGDSFPTSNGLNHATEGDAFLSAQSKDWELMLASHQSLLQSGDALSDELARARKRLQDQVESEAYVTQHFHEIARVREQIGNIRGLVEKIAMDVQDVEQFLMQQTEEYMAAQNASFVRQQQHELEKFEERILDEKEDRKKELLEARRRLLADAFQNDLKTYQTVVAYQGATLTQRAMALSPEESLEAVDLVVTTDAAQLEAFYETEEEDNMIDPLMDRLAREEEEEKTNDQDDNAGGEDQSEPLASVEQEVDTATGNDIISDATEDEVEVQTPQ